MDARGVERLLEKTLGLADTALTVGAKSAEVAVRDARLPDAVKQELVPLYGEEALRRTLNYAGLGLAVCRLIAPHLDDDLARARLRDYQSQFRRLYDDARASLDREFSGSRALEPE